MDTNLSLFNLSFDPAFADTDTSEIYNIESVTSLQETVDDVIRLEQPLRSIPPTNSLDTGSEDVLNELLSSSNHSTQVNNQSCKSVAHCEICGKDFDKMKQYHGHLRIHSKENVWTCIKCPELKFATKQQLQRHSSEHAPLARLYSCSLCSTAFDSTSKLQYHLLIKHDTNRPHKCDQCEKSFKKPSDLKKHKDTHSVRKRHTCSYCSKEFADASNLKRHVLRHTGEKPYICNCCGLRFCQLASLKRHTQKLGKLANDDANIRQHHCRICGLKFQYKSSLLEHSVREHPRNENTDVRPTQTTTDLGRTVDALIYDILCGETDDIASDNNLNSEDQHKCNISNDINAESVFQIELLKEMNKIQRLANKSDITAVESSIDCSAGTSSTKKDFCDPRVEVSMDFDNFHANQTFNFPCDINFDNISTDGNGDISCSFTDSIKNIEINSNVHFPYQFKTEKFTTDVLYKDFNEDAGKTLLNTIKSYESQENECSTIFESDVDLEISTHLAANLNQLIGENNVQYIATEDDDTFIISLNSAKDAEQLTDILNIGIDFEEQNTKTVTNKVVAKSEIELDTENKKVISSKKIKKELLLSCKICKKVFKKKDNYESHIAIHNPKLMRHKCEVCRKKFSYRSTLRRHVTACHLPLVASTFPCDLCSKNYKAAWLLREHKERDHLGIKPYKCVEKGCDRSYYKKFDLVIHQRQHARSRPYVCKKCKRAFLHASHLKRHDRSCGNQKVITLKKVLQNMRKSSAKTKIPPVLLEV